MSDVKISLGYSLDLVAPEEDLVEILSALLKLKKLDFHDYQSGEYLQHTYASLEISIKPYEFTLEEAIQKASVLDMPLHKYLQNEGK